MRRLRAALLLLLAAGCQPIPHPFADRAGLPGTPALRPPDSAGIVVLPVAGAAPPGLAAALAAALREADVPASTAAANRGSYRLASGAAAAPGGAGITLDWTLQDADGKTLGQGEAQKPAGAASPAGNAALAGALAAAVAPQVADLVSGDAPAAIDDPSPMVALRTVTGAPGDGATALARAIGEALGRSGIAVGAGSAKARFALTCGVALSAPQDGKQLVSVRWVLALPEGRELGQVSQQNTIAAGSLDGAWGDVAFAVASAAAPGIADLIEQAQATAPGG